MPGVMSHRATRSNGDGTIPQHDFSQVSTLTVLVESGYQERSGAVVRDCYHLVI
jgi:hypothetical protein